MFLPAESSGRIETVQTEGESVELKGLQTFSNYSVAVAAFTRAGAGAPDVAAARLFCMTAEDGEGEIRLKRFDSNQSHDLNQLQSRAARRTCGR